MPWIINDVEDKIQNALGMGHLNTLYIQDLYCNSRVANEFLGLLCSYDLPEQGIDKLTFINNEEICEPFEEEVISRIANMCPNLTQLKLTHMYNLSEDGRLSMASLFSQIIHNSPPIEVLNM